MKLKHGKLKKYSEKSYFHNSILIRLISILFIFSNFFKTLITKYKSKHTPKNVQSNQKS